MAESTPNVEAGKIFVGGLSWDTTKDTLKTHFSKYGEVSDAVIMVDGVTKMPRGFGFVTFKDQSSVTSAIDEQHFLDGKKIDPKEAITKDYHASSQVSKSSSIEKKVFIGGLPHSCTDDEIKDYFNKFGDITEVDIKYDRTTGKPRGFAFVEFGELKSANDATMVRFQTFKEKRIEVKPAENRNNTSSSVPSSATSNSGWTQTPGYTLPHGTQQSPYFYSYPYPTTPAYPATGTSYPSQPAPSYHTQATHATQSQSGYPSQAGAYQQSGYQQAYPGNTAYPSQTYPSGSYTQSNAGYPVGYPNSYGSSDSANSYAQSSSTSGYYPTQAVHPAYNSESSYPQAQNQRSW